MNLLTQIASLFNSARASLSARSTAGIPAAPDATAAHNQPPGLHPIASCRRGATSTTPISNPKSAAEIPLLQWWRRLPTRAFDLSHAREIELALGNIALVGAPGWPDALRGDAAACVSMAVAMLPVVEATTRADLIMTALLACAIRGNAAARFVLVRARRSLEGADHALRTGRQA